MIEWPQTIADIPRLSGDDSVSFGMSIRDFIGVYNLKRRQGADLAASLAPEPPKRAGLVAEGDIDDAFLGGLAEYLSSVDGLPPPAWAMSPSRTLKTPYYALDYDAYKKHLETHALPSFKWRNIFIDATAFDRL